MCADVCTLCDHLIISQSVSYTSGNLVINLPAGAYEDGERYCIIVAQAIPSTTTINAPVYCTIGTGTQLYPLVRRSCAQATAAGIRSRTRYATRVATTATGGSFRLLGHICPAPTNTLAAINGTATATATVTEAAADA